jgi:hypothetical protein
MAALTQLRCVDRCETPALIEEDGIQPSQLLGPPRRRRVGKRWARRSQPRRLGDAVFAPRSAAFPKEKIFEYVIPLASVKRRSAILADNVATIALWSRLDPDEVIMRVASWAIEE